MELALGMTRDEMDARLARDGLTAWDVSMRYAGGDKDCNFFSGPSQVLYRPAGGG